MISIYRGRLIIILFVISVFSFWWKHAETIKRTSRKSKTKFIIIWSLASIVISILIMIKGVPSALKNVNVEQIINIFWWQAILLFGGVYISDVIQMDQIEKLDYIWLSGFSLVLILSFTHQHVKRIRGPREIFSWMKDF